MLEGLLKCGEHDCPMIRVGDYYYCLLEYVDGLVGGQRLVQVIPDAATTPLTLVFENGRRMPLYCPDCGGPFQIPDGTGEALRALVGWHLYALGYAPVAGETPEYLELVLTPTLDPEDHSEPADEQSICVHLESARQIQ